MLIQIIQEKSKAIPQATTLDSLKNSVVSFAQASHSNPIQTNDKEEDELASELKYRLKPPDKGKLSRLRSSSFSIRRGAKNKKATTVVTKAIEESLEAELSSLVVVENDEIDDSMVAMVMDSCSNV